MPRLRGREGVLVGKNFCIFRGKKGDKVLLLRLVYISVLYRGYAKELQCARQKLFSTSNPLGKRLDLMDEQGRTPSLIDGTFNIVP